MSVKTKIKISKDLQNLIKNSQAVYDAAFQETINIANDMRTYIITKMQATTNASWSYKRPGGTRHFPSVPYNYPASDSGDFWNSLQVQFEKQGVFVGSTIKIPKYPFYLEHGTKKRNKMKPRPWMKPTIDDNQHTFEPRIRDALERFLK